TITGRDTGAPADVAAVHEQGSAFWTLAMTRELDDLILDLRTNEIEIGTWVIKTICDPERVLAHDQLLAENPADWLVNEIVHYLKRTLKRLGLSRSEGQTPELQSLTNI